MAGIRMTGFWAKTSPDGKVYHEGTLGGAVVRLFLNDYKKTDKDPDVVMYLSAKPKDAPRSQARPHPAARPAPQVTRPQAQVQPYKDHTQSSEGPPPYDAPFPSDDEMPF